LLYQDFIVVIVIKTYVLLLIN